MRKFSAVAIMSLFFLVTLASGFSEKAFAESNILSTLSGKKSPSKKDDAARDALRKIILEKKAEINGSSWSIKINSQSKKGELLGEDTLVFQNDKFRSERSDKLGYTPTNYTLTVQEAGPTIWETMQTSKKGEVCFWRGEWKENVMTGIISRQLKKAPKNIILQALRGKRSPRPRKKKKKPK